MKTALIIAAVIAAAAVGAILVLRRKPTLLGDMCAAADLPPELCNRAAEMLTAAGAAAGAAGVGAVGAVGGSVVRGITQIPIVGGLFRADCPSQPWRTDIPEGFLRDRYMAQNDICFGDPLADQGGSMTA